MRVRWFMTRKVVTAAPEDGIRETFFRMREARIRHLPVLDGAQLVGMLSDRDLRRPDWVDEAPTFPTITSWTTIFVCRT